MVPWHNINFGTHCTENLAAYMKSSLSGIEAKQRIHCANKLDGEAGMKKYKVLWWECLADELGFKTENNLNKW